VEQAIVHNLFKIWNKGIDIAANVITSLIVALIGLAFWKAKLWLDLRADETKQRQHHRICEDLDDDQRWRRAMAEAAELRLTRDSWAQSLEDVIGRVPEIELLERFCSWIKSNDLDIVRDNQQFLGRAAARIVVLRGGGDLVGQDLKREARNVVIPGPKKRIGQSGTSRGDSRE
jgi:hypothetical protein